MNVREAQPTAREPVSIDAVPGDLLADRWRVAGVAAQVPGGALVNALDERLRRRVRVLVAHALDPVRAHLRDPLLPTALASVSDGGRALVAWAFWDGAPLTLPNRPLADHREVRAWAGRCIAVLELLERIHAETGRAHGHLSLDSFWRLPDGRFQMLDVATRSAPDGRFAYPDDDPDDPRADLYAAAALFQALATGTLPFGTGDGAAVAHRLLKPAETEVLPAPILDVLRTALQKQPHHRFASAGRMKAAFQQALVAIDGRPSDPRRAPERVPVAYRLAPLQAEPTLEPAPPRRLPARFREPGGWSFLVLAVGALFSVLAWVGLAGLCVAVGQLL